MLDFLQRPRLPLSGAKSFFSDVPPDFSFSDHGAYDPKAVSPVTPIPSTCKIQEQDSTSQASLKDTSPPFSRFGKQDYSIQILFQNWSYTSPGNQSRPPSSSSAVARKGLSEKGEEAQDTSTDSSDSESRPSSFGSVFSQLKQKMDSMEPRISSLTQRPVRAAQRQPPVQSTPKTLSNTPFPFSSKDASVQRSSSDNLSDQFMDLNIQTTLFPTGLMDPYSPAAFNNLAQNAERLLSRLQAAYKECKMSLREVTAEKEAQAEELEGCQMRARHLRIQLDSMTAKLTEQDQAMMNLIDEMAQEKQSQQQRNETPKRGARASTTARANPTYKTTPGNSGILEARRGSDMSNFSAINDSGFESDEESLIDRVGVKHQDRPSPSVSVSSISTSNSRDLACLTNLPPPTISYPSAIAQPPRPKAPPMRASGLFSGAQKNPPPGWASSSTLRDPFATSCSNCQGVRASEAWNVVNVLQEENRGLKEQITHLESSFDGCLNFVSGLIDKGRMTGL